MRLLEPENYLETDLHTSMSAATLANDGHLGSVNLFWMQGRSHEALKTIGTLLKFTLVDLLGSSKCGFSAAFMANMTTLIFSSTIFELEFIMRLLNQIIGAVVAEEAIEIS